MTYLHIVAIWIFFVILITVAIIISICNKRTILSKDMDFFTSYVTKKEISSKTAELDCQPMHIS